MNLEPFATWGLSGTRADVMQPGDTLEWFCTGEEAILPYRTATGRPLAVRTSTINETRVLHNATLDPATAQWNQYTTLPEWPWTCCLDELPMPTGYLRYPYTFEAQDA